MKKIIILILLMIPINVLGIDTSARCAILMDIDNNRILYEKNINEVRSVASISKIMTAVIAIESGLLDDNVVISDEIDKAYGSGIYIQKGEVLTLRDLLYGLMLRSGNDASLSIARYVAGNVEDFVLLMNEKAKEIGMNNTTFNNPNGLDNEEGNYSTAYDMAILTSYAMKLDEYRQITSTKKYTLKTNKNYYSWINKNKLLTTYKYTTGGKTGFTEIAKRTLVSTATKDNINLVVVTLNDGNDWLDHQKLFEYGFNNYTNISILKEGIINIYNESYYSKYDLYLNNNFNYLISNSEMDSLLIKYNLQKNININSNNIVGDASVYLGNKLIYSTDIYAKEKQIKKSYIDKIIEWIKNIW